MYSIFLEQNMHHDFRKQIQEFVDTKNLCFCGPLCTSWAPILAWAILQHLREKNVYSFLGVATCNAIAAPTQQSSSPSCGIPCTHKQGNDNRVTAV
jgi:hypothetical protein